MSIRTKAEREAIERIDSAILTAVKLLYTVDKPPIAICDDDGARPKQRDNSLSKEIYDHMLDTAEGPVCVDVTWYDIDELRENYREGKEQYLFMTPEDFAYYGYSQESCQ